jgi:hypothetical protein
VALGAGVGVALAKAGAAASTGSSAMAAEASHSLADTANDLFLFVAQRRSTRSRDDQHPRYATWSEILSTSQKASTGSISCRWKTADRELNRPGLPLIDHDHGAGGIPVGRVTGTTVSKRSRPAKSPGLVVKRRRSSAMATDAIIRSTARRRGLRPAATTAAVT